jgi:hypothetical protein
MWHIDTITAPAGSPARIFGGEPGAGAVTTAGDRLGPQGALYTVSLPELGYLTLADIGWTSGGWTVLVNGRTNWCYGGEGHVAISVDPGGGVTLAGGAANVQERLQVGDVDPSLGGWDTISSVSMAKVNQSLATSSAKLPAQFESHSAGASVNGTLGPWQIVTGGSGEYLYLGLPITGGTLSIDGLGNVDLSGLQAIMELSLRLVPSADGSLQNLCFSLQTAAPPGSPAAPGLVTGVTVVDPTDRLGVAQKAVLLAEMAQFLVANASTVAYVFASINAVPPQTGGWLTPKQSVYYYTETQGALGPIGYLSILSVVDDRDVSQLLPVVPPRLLTSTPTMTFAIAAHLFLGTQVAPRLPAALGSSAAASNFVLDPTDSIVNVSRFDLGGVTAGAITYHPQANSLHTRIVGGNLTTSVQGDCDLYAGISMSFSVACSNAFSFTPAGQTIAFAGDPSPQISHDEDIPWYLKWLSLLVGAIVSAIVSLIADSLANSLTNNISGAAKTAIGDMSVQWVGVTAFTATSGVLDGALILKST